MKKLLAFILLLAIAPASLYPAGPTDVKDPKLYGAADLSGITNKPVVLGQLGMSNDGTMAANSSSLFPTQAAVVTYVAAHTGAASDTAFAASWNAVTTIPPSKNALYDWAHLFDTNDNGKVNVLDIGAGIPKTDSSGVVSVR